VWEGVAAQREGADDANDCATMGRAGCREERGEAVRGYADQRHLRTADIHVVRMLSPSFSLEMVWGWRPVS
jgi:hypothetical protein